MAPILAASLVSGGAGLLGGFLQNSANKSLQQDANDANQRIAAENRAWAEMMANTAHQREVRDLKAAGLNPILSATGGSGAATPSAPIASVDAARVEDTLGKGVSSALAARQLENALEAQESQTNLNTVTAETKKTEQVANIASAKASAAAAANTAEKTKGERLANKGLEAQLPAMAAKAKADEATAQWDKSAAGYDAIVNRGLNLLGGISSAAGKLFRPDITHKNTQVENKALKKENETMKTYINNKGGMKK